MLIPTRMLKIPKVITKVFLRISDKNGTKIALVDSKIIGINQIDIEIRSLRIKFVPTPTSNVTKRNVDTISK
jgi:hypothetical protein